MPSLVSAYTIIIGRQLLLMVSATRASLQALTDGMAQSVSFESLEYIQQDLSVEVCAFLFAVNAPKLKTAFSITLSFLPQLLYVELSSLLSVGQSISFVNNADMPLPNLPLLSSGSVLLASCPKVDSMSLPSLVHGAVFALGNPNLVSVDTPSLEISQSLAFMDNAKLVSISMPRLNYVAGVYSDVTVLPLTFLWTFYSSTLADLFGHIDVRENIINLLFGAITIIGSPLLTNVTMPSLYSAVYLLIGNTDVCVDEMLFAPATFVYLCRATLNAPPASCGAEPGWRACFNSTFT
jgi:hypothetical protein